jgi:hypothetical protein
MANSTDDGTPAGVSPYTTAVSTSSHPDSSKFSNTTNWPAWLVLFGRGCGEPTHVQARAVSLPLGSHGAVASSVEMMSAETVQLEGFGGSRQPPRRKRPVREVTPYPAPVSDALAVRREAERVGNDGAATPAVAPTAAATGGGGECCCAVQQENEDDEKKAHIPLRELAHSTTVSKFLCH